jgi:hypothetical protein
LSVEPASGPCRRLLSVMPYKNKAIIFFSSHIDN